jgi:hypothetical protein
MHKPVSAAYILSFRGRLWEDADHEYYCLLCDLTFEGAASDSSGGVKGVLSVYHSKDVNIVLRGDLRLLPPSKWSTDPVSGITTVVLHVFIEAVEGAEALNHVTVRADGVYANRQCTGHYDVYKMGKVVEQAPWPKKAQRTFTLHEATPVHCARCWSEVILDEPPVCVECGSSAYCSSDCMAADRADHAEMCVVAGQVGDHGPITRLVVWYQGTPFNVFFRSAKNIHTVYIDARNPVTGRQYSMTLDVFDDNRKEHKGSATYSAQHGQNIVVLEKVAMCAITGQRTSLAASCLHWLHCDCHEMDTLERLYAMYYEYILCVGHDMEVMKHICVGEDYLVLARPLYEYATVLVEGALKSRLPSEFWARIDIAKNIAIQLFNSNSSAKFPRELMTDIVSHQQRQVLHLLARIFVTMASRLPRPRSDDILRRAIECYVDTIEDPLLHGSVLDLARTHLRLSCVYLMRDSDDWRARAYKERQAAFDLLDKHYASAPPATAPPTMCHSSPAETQ